jgi:hypothetical protein
MFADESHFDAIDERLHRNLERWVVLTWRNDLFLPPKDIPYGTHLATYLFCPPSGEIHGANVCWLVQSAPDYFHRACDLAQGIEAQWHFRYETLRKFQLTEITDAQIDALRLPRRFMDFPVDPTLRVFRSRREFDQFRHSGFPDEIHVAYGSKTEWQGTTVLGEQVWVRVARQIDENVLEGTLLNQPVMYRGTKGGSVRVQVIKTDTATILACSPSYKDNKV